MVVNSHPLYQLSYRGSGCDRWAIGLAGATPARRSGVISNRLRGCKVFAALPRADFRLASDPLQAPAIVIDVPDLRSEEQPSELQSLMPISSAVFCLKQNTHT